MDIVVVFLRVAITFIYEGVATAGNFPWGTPTVGVVGLGKLESAVAFPSSEPTCKGPVGTAHDPKPLVSDNDTIVPTNVIGSDPRYPRSNPSDLHWMDPANFTKLEHAFNMSHVCEHVALTAVNPIKESTKNLDPRSRLVIDASIVRTRHSWEEYLETRDTFYASVTAGSNGIVPSNMS